MRRPSRQLNIFSISALDLFASAMGAFVIIAVILFPYYMKNDDFMERARKAEKEARIATKEIEKAKKIAAQNEAAKRKAEREADALRPKDIEIVFICDTTASMGSHLEGIKTNLKDVVDTLKLVNKRIRIGFIAYRDIAERGVPNTYVTKSFPIREMNDSSFRSLSQFVDSLQAGSIKNRDKPESVSIALQSASSMEWAQGNWTRIIVVITDASAHQPTNAFAQAANFSSNSQSTSKLTAILAKSDNVDPKAPSFLRTLANRGKGEYIEDSGRMLSSLIRATLTK